MNFKISEKDKFKIAFCLTIAYDMLVVITVGELLRPTLPLIIITSVANILALRYIYKLNKKNQYMADSFVRTLLWLAPLDITVLIAFWI